MPVRGALHSPAPLRVAAAAHALTLEAPACVWRWRVRAPADKLSRKENGVALLTDIINSLFDPVIAIVTECVRAPASAVCPPPVPHAAAAVPLTPPRCACAPRFAPQVRR